MITVAIKVSSRTKKIKEKNHEGSERPSLYEKHARKSKLVSLVNSMAPAGNLQLRDGLLFGGVLCLNDELETSSSDVSEPSIPDKESYESEASSPYSDSISSSELEKITLLQW